MSTFVEDLVTALDEEAQTHLGRYLELVKQAEEMEYPQIAKFLRAIIAVETVRAGLYRECLASSERQTEAYDYYICHNCGVVWAGEAPEKCPLCDTQGTQFERIS